MSYSYRIELAIKAASILHLDQKRKGKGSVPYVSHLFSVAMLIADYVSDEDTIIAGLLHDTLEDTDYTSKELENDFGPRVFSIVKEVSEYTRNLGEIPSWRERKKTYLENLKTASEAGLIVASADKIHNMRSVIGEYYHSHREFREEFGGSLDERLMFLQKVSNILNRRLKNDILIEFNHVFDEYKKFIEYIIREKDK